MANDDLDVVLTGDPVRDARALLIAHVEDALGDAAFAGGDGSDGGDAGLVRRVEAFEAAVRADERTRVVNYHEIVE